MGQSPDANRSEVEIAREQLAATLAALTHRASAPRRAGEHAAARAQHLSNRARRLVGR